MSTTLLLLTGGGTVLTLLVGLAYFINAYLPKRAKAKILAEKEKRFIALTGLTSLPMYAKSPLTWRTEIQIMQPRIDEVMTQIAMRANITFEAQKQEAKFNPETAVLATGTTNQVAQEKLEALRKHQSKMPKLNEVAAKAKKEYFSAIDFFRELGFEVRKFKEYPKNVPSSEAVCK